MLFNCITNINSLLKNNTIEFTEFRIEFNIFLKALQRELNESITEGDLVGMLAQYVITKPIFDELFKDYSFSANNIVSQAMQKLIDLLPDNKDQLKSLEVFYADTKIRIGATNSSENKQRIIKDLYNEFFTKAFPLMVDKLGVVYTPIELVDFVIHSVQDILKQEFGASIGDKGVHILDPFTGTGTFITRLLQSGLITKSELEYKYKNEIHANEIILMAYYVASINIEQVYHDISKSEYSPFEGICLTDTFRLHEKGDLFDSALKDNTSRRQRQKELDIRVIMGNPPYSAGQKNANDNNANVKYNDLDDRIKATYLKERLGQGKHKSHDSYIRAIRWGSDRLGKSGVMAFVTPATWLDKNTNDGMRKCLANEFSSIYIFNLRGNNSYGMMGENGKKEGDSIFVGSRLPIAITVFVKNPDAPKECKIYYHDIGDYLKRDEKFTKIKDFKSIAGIKEKDAWEIITPNKKYDWINQRADVDQYYSFMPIGTNKQGKKETSIFMMNYSCGINTARDAWAYNYSAKEVSYNMERMIKFYNEELERKSTYESTGEGFEMCYDSKKIKWSDDLKTSFNKKNQNLCFDKYKIRLSVYRPFSNRYLYYDKMIIDRICQMPKLFPDAKAKNLLICVTSSNYQGKYGCFIVDKISDLGLQSNAQNFPIRVYNTEEKNHNNLFGNNNSSNYTHGVSDVGLKHFQMAYPDSTITKDDIFYYIYGLLHSTEYREKYHNFLIKDLAKIPRVKHIQDFMKFSKAGRDLAKLHLDYDKEDMYPVTFAKGLSSLHALESVDKDASYYYVTKMKHNIINKQNDLSTIIYNNNITITGIPIEAYKYTVGNKTAIGWVMDQQQVKTDKTTNITNDSNRYATETMHDPAYPLKLLLRVITVSMKTMKIIKSLPDLEI